MSQMNEVQHALRKGTYDLPRMTRVLDHERVRFAPGFRSSDHLNGIG